MAHSWGEFMNIGFKYASSPYIVMVSDDLILEPGCLQYGYDEMENRRKNGEKVGSGAFFLENTLGMIIIELEFYLEVILR